MCGMLSLYLVALFREFMETLGGESYLEETTIKGMALRVPFSSLSRDEWLPLHRLLWCSFSLQIQH